VSPAAVPRTALGREQAEVGLAQPDGGQREPAVDGPAERDV
jgi:hypothetical protein